jgi:hypothetical protein
MDGCIIGGGLMRHCRLRWFSAGILLAVIVILPAIARAQTVDVAIVLAADVSRSIDDEEFQLQRHGYAAASTPSGTLPAMPD